MSIFDKDLVEKEIPLYSEDTILGNKITFMGVLPEGTDVSHYIKIDNSFICDPTNGELYILQSSDLFSVYISKDSSSIC